MQARTIKNQFVTATYTLTQKHSLGYGSVSQYFHSDAVNSNFLAIKN